MDYKPRRRVLIADDSRDTVESMKLLFEAEGCEVRVCESGREVLQCAPEFRAHVAILDLDFGAPPDGLAVITQLRAHPELTGLVIAAVTGWARPADMDRALGAGCDYFFAKPADPEELLQLVLTLDRRRNAGVMPLVERRVATAKPGSGPQEQGDKVWQQELQSPVIQDRRLE